MKYLIYFLMLAIVSFRDFGNVALAVGPDIATEGWEKSAKVLFDQKDYKQVIAILGPHLAELKSDSVLLLGKSYDHLNDHISAQKTFQAGTTKFPDNLEMQSLLGEQICSIAKDMSSGPLAGNKSYQTQVKAKYDEGLQIIRGALEKNKKLEIAYLILLRIYKETKNNMEFLNAAQDLVTNVGPTPANLKVFCDALTQESLFEQAAKVCAQAVKADDQCEQCLLNLAKVKSETFVTAEADNLYKEAATKFSKSEDAQMAYAKYLEGEKNFIGAFEYYRKAAALNTKSKEALVGVAKSGMEIQKYAEALEAFKTVCPREKKIIPDFRRAAATFKDAKDKVWFEKFEEGVKSCYPDGGVVSY